MLRRSPAYQLIQRKWRGYSLSNHLHLSTESNNGKNSRKFSSLFPWRSSPFDTKFPLWDSIKQVMIKFYFFHFISDISEKELLEGAITAYEDSIINLISYVERRDDNEGEKLLQMTFAPKIALFYQKWLKEFFKEYPIGSIKIHHRIFDDKDVPITVKFEACVASNFTSITEETFQSIAPLEYEEYRMNRLGGIETIELEDGRKKVIMNTAYIRFDVNIRCKEVLYIEDTRTGEVIQGTKEPVIYTHHVALGFAGIRHPSVMIDSGWRIVDIDQWRLSGIDRYLGWHEEIESTVNTFI